MASGTIQSPYPNDDSGIIAVTSISNASNYSAYGNCSYRKIGRVVNVHIGIKSLVNAAIQGPKATIFTLPTGYRPAKDTYSVGQGGDTYTAISYGTINTLGEVKISSDDQYAVMDFMFLV